MLALGHQRVPLCDGVSRREWLRVGALGAAGIMLPELLRGRAVARAAERSARSPAGQRSFGRSFDGAFGRAKSCILCFLFGAPAHQDIWDLKPEAPADVRGEFGPIDTSVPGILLGEHVPHVAKTAHRFALIRSVQHPDNTHTVAMHYMLTGRRHARPETNPQNQPGDFPCFGAVMQYLRREGTPASPPFGRGGQKTPAGRADQNPPYPPFGRGGEEVGPFGSGGQAGAAIAKRTALPAGISLNSPANQVSANNHIFPGFFAGILGGSFDPLFIPQDPSRADFQPFPAAGDDLAARLVRAKGLAGEVDALRRDLDSIAAVRSFDAYYERAFSLVTSPAARAAFDLSREADKTRDRFGRSPFGQGCLLARRLVEAGVSLVTVNWARDDAFWDTHKDNFKDLKAKLLPPFDLAFSALLEDLDERGLLDETLVVCLGEFGRTPKINGNAGRDHWAACNSVVLAGAGIRGGAVHGSSDRLAAYPASFPVSPDDLAATIYHALGVDPQLELRDSLDRPLQLTTGRVLTELW